MAADAAWAAAARSGDIETLGLTTRSPAGADQVRTGHDVAIWQNTSDGRWVCVVESTIFGPDRGP